MFKIIFVNLQVPTSAEEWKNIAENFATKWQFDHCLCAIDGKHVVINKPKNSGSLFYNYKGTFSVVLFVIADANYQIIYVNTGTNGRASDGGIWESSEICRKLNNNELNIPNPENLPRTTTKVPYVFIGDQAFPLMNNLMKPFAHRQITHSKKIFNYRLSRARRVVENTFGIMASRFRSLLQPFAVDLPNLDKIILGLCTLHNFLLKNSATHYAPPTYLDSEDTENNTINRGEWRNVGEMLELETIQGANSSANAKLVRDKFMDYFLNEGQTSFQNHMVLHNY